MPCGECSWEVTREGIRGEEASDWSLRDPAFTLFSRDANPDWIGALLTRESS